MDRDEVCVELPWDSAFFGLRLARLTTRGEPPGGVKAALDWCAARAVDGLYWLVPAGDLAAAWAAARGGFLLADIRLTLALSPVRAPDGGKGGGCATVRRAREEDAPTLEAIARASHHEARFCADPHFPAGSGERLYALWIAKSLKTAGAVWVAERNGEAAGYATCERTVDGSGQIGLLAVSPAARGVGIGRQLVRAALGWFAEAGCGRATVVTQGRNAASQRLYQGCGFRTESVELWYHWWRTALRDRSEEARA
jgi:ribosomal protein S18 acetylase RimI-like enzyme